MMVIEWVLRVPAPEGALALMEAVASACAQTEGIGRCQACAVLTDDADIRALNAAARGIDAATDVLSFPQTDFPNGTARDYPKRLRRQLDPDTGRAHLGDVVISVERAQAQAAAYGHSLARELGYLLAHGLCHLMGYDHLCEADKARMRTAEESALALVGLPRAQEGEAPREETPQP